MSIRNITAQVGLIRSVKSIPSRLVKDTEKMLLAEQGFPTDVRSFKIGDAFDLMLYLSQQGVALNQKAREIVRMQGYNWRKEPCMQYNDPKIALYLDTLARLNDIHGQLYLEEDLRTHTMQRILRGQA